MRLVDKLGSMAEEMSDADIVITSAGRTVYEAAAVGVPVVTLAQSAREATHAHLTIDAGVVFLGLGVLVADEQIVGTVNRLLNDHRLREELGATSSLHRRPWCRTYRSRNRFNA